MGKGLLKKRAETISNLAGFRAAEPDAPRATDPSSVWLERAEGRRKKFMKAGQPLRSAESKKHSDLALKWYTQGMRRKRVESGLSRMKGGREIAAGKGVK